MPKFVFHQTLNEEDIKALIKKAYGNDVNISFEMKDVQEFNGRHIVKKQRLSCKIISK